jgi:hypothetical protein
MMQHVCSSRHNQDRVGWRRQGARLRHHNRDHSWLYLVPWYGHAQRVCIWAGAIGRATGVQSVARAGSSTPRQDNGNHGTKQHCRAYLV